MKVTFIRRVWREPLVHFLLIGAALFVFYDQTREQGSEAPNRIVMSSGQVFAPHSHRRPIRTVALATARSPHASRVDQGG
jgi:hypothetical protein